MAQRKLSQKQIEAVLQLNGPSRYDHFIKQVVDCEEAWGLYDEGWALGGSDEGDDLLEIWPAEDYARLAIGGAWEHYEPKAISLDELVEDFLPGLQAEGIGVAIFRTPEGMSVTPTIDRLLADLKTEMSRYE